MEEGKGGKPIGISDPSGRAGSDVPMRDLSELSESRPGVSFDHKRAKARNADAKKRTMSSWCSKMGRNTWLWRFTRNMRQKHALLRTGCIFSPASEGGSLHPQQDPSSLNWSYLTTPTHRIGTKYTRTRHRPARAPPTAEKPIREAPHQTAQESRE